MLIEIELDTQHQERLQQLQEAWHQPLNQVVARLIDSAYTLEPSESAMTTMLASEAVLSRDWNTEEEEAAWAHL